MMMMIVGFRGNRSKMDTESDSFIGEEGRSEARGTGSTQTSQYVVKL
jgi:hypothetical protein